MAISAEENWITVERRDALELDSVTGVKAGDLECMAVGLKSKPEMDLARP